MHLAAMAAVLATAAGQLGCPPAPPAGSAQPVALERPAPAPCTAALPARGASFAGTVLQVIDGRTLCVAHGASPDQWLRVRLGDAGPGLTRGALMAAAFARQVTCVATGADGDGVVAVCVSDGRSVGRAAAEPDAAAQAAAWR